MKIKGTFESSGVDFYFTINEKDIMAMLSANGDLNQKRAAAYCGVDRKTFLKWNIPKNENGRYSVELLKARKK